MRYLIGLNPGLWRIVVVGITFLEEDEPITNAQELEIQQNMQAVTVLLSSLCLKDFDKVDGMHSAKDIWDTLWINHEGTERVRQGRVRALEQELNRFTIRKNETPQEMFNRLKKIVNKIRALGGQRWTDSEVVDKILSAYMARDVNLPILIR